MKHIITDSFLEAIIQPSFYKEEAEKKDKIRLEDIQAYIDKYRGRRGRKNKILQIIDDIEKLEDKEIKNNVVKYAGVYLTQLKTNIDWTSEDILAAILSDVELTKKYANAIDKGGEIKAKELGEELAKEYLKRETEKADFMKMLYESMKSGTHRMIHQLPQDKYKEIESSIFGLFKLNKRLLEVFFNATRERMFQLLLDDMNKIIVKKDSDLTYSFINSLIDNLFKVSVSVKRILKEDKPRGYEVKLKEIENFEDSLKSISGKYYTLWPESEVEIKSVEGLVEYFKEVEKYRKDAEKLIAKYKGRIKELKPPPKKKVTWTEELISKTIKQYIETENLDTMKGTLAPHISDIINVAEKILSENTGIVKFYGINKTEKALQELVAKIAYKITRYVPYQVRFDLEKSKAYNPLDDLGKD